MRFITRETENESPRLSIFEARSTSLIFVQHEKKKGRVHANAQVKNRRSEKDLE
jgi:hypothetical protein